MEQQLKLPENFILNNIYPSSITQGLRSKYAQQLVMERNRQLMEVAKQRVARAQPKARSDFDSL